jgi:hypothetical protein
VRKGVEQLVVLVQDNLFLLISFFAILLTMVGTLKNNRAHFIYYGHLHPQRHDKTCQHEVHDDLLALVSSAIPCFDGNFDPRAYIEWELKVEKEFDEHDLSEAQMIYLLLML